MRGEDYRKKISKYHHWDYLIKDKQPLEMLTTFLGIIIADGPFESYKSLKELETNRINSIKQT